VKTSQGYRLRDPDVYREFDNLWNAKGVSVDACIKAAYASLKASRVLAPLSCPKCGQLHLDNYALAITEHVSHEFTACGA